MGFKHVILKASRQIAGECIRRRLRANPAEAHFFFLYFTIFAAAYTAFQNRHDRGIYQINDELLPGLYKSYIFMKKLLSYLFSPLHYLVFGIILILFHPIQWLSLKLGGYTAHKRSVDIMNALIVGTYYIMGARVNFISESKLPADRSIIFVANHQSLYDIPVLIWKLRKHHPKFISKIELTRGIPSISFNLKYGGAANIDRKDPKQSITELLKLADRMKKNTWSTVIFPEGTRSKTGRMKPFASAGLTTLIKKVPGALVVPVAIENSWKLTRYGLFPLSFGEDMRWTLLEPIDPAGKSPDEVIAASELAIRRIADPQSVQASV